MLRFVNLLIGISWVFIEQSDEAAEFSWGQTDELVHSRSDPEFGAISFRRGHAAEHVAVEVQTAQWVPQLSWIVVERTDEPS